jgi:hypothetical protein
LLHQALDRATCDRNAFSVHLLPDFICPIDLHVALSDALDLGLQERIAFGSRTQPRRIAQLCSVAPIARRGNPQDCADRLDPEGAAMLIDKGLQDFVRRSNSAWAKNALASLKISLARRSVQQQLLLPPH